MRLDVLTEDVDADFANANVTGFAINHRKVAPGTIFGAFKGTRFNGEDYIADAVKSGAVAVVARPEAVVEGALHIADDNPRKRFATLAARFFSPFPATIVAITGTNGKTSNVELTRQLWNLAGKHSASIGTLGVTTANDQVTTGLTTPEVVTFLNNVSGLATEGVTNLAFEASSHGLEQYRIEGLPVIAAAFTNLSRDHLDYHGDMDSYFDAKMRLFDEIVVDGGTAVVWADDEWSDKVIARVKARGLKLMTVGEKGEDITLLSRSLTPLGQVLSIAIGETTHTVKLPLIGAYQAANALTSAALVMATGGDTKQTLDHLARVQTVRGRLERAAITKTGVPIYVDYAHTPDGLDAAIMALKPHAKGRLILVFGAGGDRDVGKRPEMGAIATNKADVVIVTDDNPRTEDPAAIRAAIMTAAPGAIEIGDRREAIAAAVAEARDGDIICIAGKGHEQGQIVGDLVLPFDDVMVARECAA